MTTAYDIYVEASQRGLRLEPAGDKLAIIPKGKCPPDFANILRLHKKELLEWLESRNNHLSPDCQPWLHVARQVLDGEFDDASRSTVKSLVIGLRGIEHPTCRRALNQLKNRNSCK